MDDTAGTAPPQVPNCLKLVNTLKGHARAVASVRFSPTGGDVLATASADSTAAIWDASSGSQLCSLRGHDRGVSDAAWSPDGRYVCTVSDDLSAKLWDAGTGTCLRTLTGHSNYVCCADFDPHGHLLATGSFDETVRVWDVRGGRCLREIPAHSDPITGVHFNHDGTLLASSSYDGLIRLWDTLNGHCLKTLLDQDSPPLAFVRFAPNGKYVLSGDLDGKIRLWDFERSRCAKSLRGHAASSMCLTACFVTTTARPLVACGSEDASLYLWDLNSRKVVSVVPGRADADQLGDGHCDAVLCVAAHPRKTLLASCGHKQDAAVKLWALQDGMQL